MTNDRDLILCRVRTRSVSVFKHKAKVSFANSIFSKGTSFVSYRLVFLTDSIFSKRKIRLYFKK